MSVLDWYLIIWYGGSCNAGDLENVKYPFIAVAPRHRLVEIDSDLSMEQIELFDI